MPPSRKPRICRNNAACDNPSQGYRRAPGHENRSERQRLDLSPPPAQVALPPCVRTPFRGLGSRMQLRWRSAGPFRSEVAGSIPAVCTMDSGSRITPKRAAPQQKKERVTQADLSQDVHERPRGRSARIGDQENPQQDHSSDPRQMACPSMRHTNVPRAGAYVGVGHRHADHEHERRLNQVPEAAADPLGVIELMIHRPARSRESGASFRWFRAVAARPKPLKASATMIRPR